MEMLHIAPVKTRYATFVCHCFLHVYYSHRETIVQKVKSELFYSSEPFEFCGFFLTLLYLGFIAHIVIFALMHKMITRNKLY